MGSGYGAAAPVQLSQLWVLPASVSCGVLESPGRGVMDILMAALPAPNMVPKLGAAVVQPAGPLYVGQEVAVSVDAMDGDGDALQLRLTFFGAIPRFVRSPGWSWALVV